MSQDILTRLDLHHQTMQSFDMRQAFADDKRQKRVNDFYLTPCDLYIDYSKNLITKETINLLLELAKQKGVVELFMAQCKGEIVNPTENMPALHTAMRALVTDEYSERADEEAQIAREVRNRIYVLNQKIITGKLLGISGKPISRVVNFGIGGSYLGASMICNALPAQPNAPKVEFVASLSPDAMSLDDLETTLFIISSKSFTTEETLTCVSRVLDSYHGDKKKFLAQHFYAVTATVDKAKEFGVNDENILKMPKSVGGRFSLWSAIGMPIILHCGKRAFEQLLRGARDMDNHCLNSTPANNPALIMALLSYWYVNYWQSSTICINTYEHLLAGFSGFLQQLVMESCGKSTPITNSDDNSNYIAPVKSEILWGGEGTAIQHSYMQLCHQGDKFIPMDFIFGALPPDANNKSQYELKMHSTLVAHALAQSQALLMGRSEKEAQEEANNKGLPVEYAKHLIMSGNRPNTCIVYKSLTPYSLGTLVSLYEHKTAMFGYLSSINPFDQWGVELGKQLSKQIKEQLIGNVQEQSGQDGSTSELINYIRANS